MKNIVTPTLNDSDDGRYLTGFDRELFCARQLYYKFIDWKEAKKDWFNDAVAYQLRMLANIILKGNQEQKHSAISLHTSYIRFIQQ